MFTEIDRHALAAPLSAAGSIKNLAQYLKTGAVDERHTARALFRWIAHNITYNTSALGQIWDRNRSAQETAEAVLQRRTAVCAGYSELFLSLAQSAGLTAEKISGNVKGPGYKAGSLASGDDTHAWNAVLLEGKWQLIDCTWGAGHMISTAGGPRYARGFNDYYFLPSPGEMIYSHFPEIRRWQMLTPPQTQTHWEQLPLAHSAFFRCGLRFHSHHTAVVTSEGPFSVSLSGPDKTRVFAQLNSDREMLDDQWTLTQHLNGRIVVHCFFPKPGDYDLSIFAAPDHHSSGFEKAAEYSVHCTFSGMGERFPEVFGAFYTHRCVVNSPLTGTLRRERPVIFDVCAPNAVAVAVVSGKAWTHLSPLGDSFQGRVSLGSGVTEVCARWQGGENSSFDVLLRYQVI